MTMKPTYSFPRSETRSGQCICLSCCGILFSCICGSAVISRKEQSSRVRLSGIVYTQAASRRSFRSGGGRTQADRRDFNVRRLFVGSCVGDQVRGTTKVYRVHIVHRALGDDILRPVWVYKLRVHASCETLSI